MTVFEPLVFNRILLTIDEDDSASTKRAFRYAVTLAQSSNVELGICSVIENHDINIYDSMMPAKLEEKREQLQTVVDGYVSQAQVAGAKNVTGFIAEGGDVDDVILEEALPDFHPDLIVCGADTEFTAHRVAGAVSLRLAKKAPISVIVVR